MYLTADSSGVKLQPANQTSCLSKTPVDQSPYVDILYSLVLKKPLIW